MARRRFIDYRIRPRGSPEVAYDPFLIMTMSEQAKRNADPGRARRVVKVYNLILKIALEILPPKQRKVFYSVWVRSNGKLSKGVMEFSRKTGQSHYTNYNSYYKGCTSLKKYLEKSGYAEHIINYLAGDAEELEPLDA